jgi:hypothetical protein
MVLGRATVLPFFNMTKYNSQDRRRSIVFCICGASKEEEKLSTGELWNKEERCALSQLASLG